VRACAPSRLAALVLAWLTAACSVAGSLRDDETVVLFPALGWRAAEGAPWTVELHGWIFEPEDDDRLRRASIAAARAALGIEAEAEQSATFRDRIAPFLVDSQRGKVATVRVAGQQWSTPPTGANGHFALVFELPAALAGTHSVHVALPDGDSRRIAGVVHLVEPQGRMVVSDVDDTVKVSNVLDRRALLRATFLEPFRAVPGMADRYRAWHAQDGTHVHFVSSSPWQLYAALSGFIESEGFPLATYSLKSVRFKDVTALELLADPFAAKTAAVERILARYPRRRFVLVGDSGERDLGIYGDLARRFPEQVEAVFIRNVTGEPADAPRYAEAFAGVPAERTAVFLDASELPPLLP
jgi:phosphatidate phosphatase APP1